MIIVHTVIRKERSNFYQLRRMYFMTPKEEKRAVGAVLAVYVDLGYLMITIYSTDFNRL
jgi:hypothetical protein